MRFVECLLGHFVKRGRIPTCFPSFGIVLLSVFGHSSKVNILLVAAVTWVQPKMCKRLGNDSSANK